MKKYLTIFTIAILVNSISFAQCNIQGGDFEEFQDISSLYTDYGYYNFCTDTAIIGSPNFVSFNRFLTLSFDTIFSGLEVGCKQFIGIHQHPEGANETSAALKLQPDTLLNFADAFTLFTCDTLPAALKGSILHVGSDLDSANVTIAFLSGIQEDAAATGIITFNGGNNEFTDFEIPIEVVDSEINIDTVAIVLSAYSDSSYLAEGNESYYVFDELELVYREPVSVFDYEVFNQFTISPNPAIDFITVSSTHNALQHIKVYNENGALVIKQNEVLDFSTKLDISRLPIGLYLIEVTGKDFKKIKRFVKSRP